MHKQVSGWTVNFCPNSPVCPFLEFQTRKPPSPQWKTSDLRWPKFTPVYHPPSQNGKLQIWDDQSLLRFTPPPQNGKLQIWDDQSLLQFTPLPKWKTSDLRWPKFTPVYPLPPTNSLAIRGIVCGDLSVTPGDTTRYVLPYESLYPGSTDWKLSSLIWNLCHYILKSQTVKTILCKRFTALTFFCWTFSVHPIELLQKLSKWRVRLYRVELNWRG